MSYKIALHGNLEREARPLLKRYRSLSSIFLIALLAITGCGSPDEPQTLESAVLAEASSQSGTLKAVVLKRGDQYRFAIQSRDGTLSVVDQDFVPKGYHAPIVTLTWKSVNKVIVSVDHDFGEGILTFVYDTRDFSWTKQE